MPAESDQGTRTVRIAGEAATTLQTITALKAQMGLKFKPVEFLNSLVEQPISELYEQTLKEFDDFKAATRRKKSK